MSVERWRPERVFVYRHPVDMRRSFDGLAAIAQNVLSVPAASGDWFVFINRRVNRVSFCVSPIQCRVG
jgi:transposase